MSKLSNKIWYGTFHHSDDIHRPSLLPILAWVAFLMLIAAWRLSLPFVETSALNVHQAILDSLTQGQVWGRQTLVGSPEFPPLVTLALFVAATVGEWLHLPTGHVLIAVSQVWALFYFLRIPDKISNRLITGVVILLLLALTPTARQVFYRLDPTWIMAVPAACGLYHFIHWCRHNALRDIVLLGINCGLLAFAGPVGLFLALIMLALTTLRLLAQKRRNTISIPASSINGMNLLAWAPFVYLFVLIFLGNWLIMGNPFFFAMRLFHNLALFNLTGFIQEISRQLATVSWVIIGGLVMALTSLRDRQGRPWAVTIAVGLAGLFLLQAFLNTINYHSPGSQELLLLLAVAGLLLPLWSLDFKPSPAITAETKNWLPVQVGLIAAFLMLGYVNPRADIGYPELYNPPPPPTLEIIALIDRHTPETRIMVYGLRAPARYPDLPEHRFLARLDVDLQALHDYARDEDFFYLLVPPNNGKFYSPASPLAEIHRHGQPWLLLEKAWPTGWQLWQVLQASPTRE